MTCAGVAGIGSAGAGALWHGIRNPNCSWFGSSILHGPTTEPVVALTFDDGPSESTPLLLNILAQYGVQASFFQCGASVARLPDVTREVAAAGHDVCNHTYSHPRLCLKSRGFIRREIDVSQTLIAEILNKSPDFFRPPFGLRWFGLDSVQREFRLTSVLWSTIGHDWAWPADRITDHILQTTGMGAIICLHDGRRLTSNPDIGPTIEAVCRLIPKLLDRGYRFEPLRRLVPKSDHAELLQR